MRRFFKLKLFVFLIICIICFEIIGAIVPPIAGFCSVICKICGVAAVMIVLFSVFGRLFGR